MDEEKINKFSLAKNSAVSFGNFAMLRSWLARGAEQQLSRLLNN
jgi:hypothetical protein